MTNYTDPTNEFLELVDPWEITIDEYNEPELEREPVYYEYDTPPVHAHPDRHEAPFNLTFWSIIWFVMFLPGIVIRSVWRKTAQWVDRHHLEDREWLICQEGINPIYITGETYDEIRNRHKWQFVDFAWAFFLTFLVYFFIYLFTGGA